MLTLFSLTESGLQRGDPAMAADRLGEAFWIDLAEPSEEERARVEHLHHLGLPDAEDLEEIEASSRSYVDARGLHISSLFLRRVEGRVETVNAAVLITTDRLITIHEPEVPAVRLLRMRAPRLGGLSTPLDLVQELYEIKLDDLADTLEEIHQDLDALGVGALASPGTDMAAMIDRLTQLEHLNSKVRLCLVDAQRDLVFLARHGGLDKAQRRAIDTLQRDADSLLPHCTFLFEKVGFLLQALQGAINIQQNQIIKIFSVIAVVFLPPTLVASSYGMNFEFMPELAWPLGYPFALVLMVLSALAPYLWFRRKGWL